MKIKSVLIKNYKSIKEITIPFNHYGENESKSHTAFLVGINESGKSAILEAINLISIGFEEADYSAICFLPSQEQNEYIDIYANLEIENFSLWSDELKEKLKIVDELATKIKIVKIEKNVYINNEHSGFQYIVEIEDILLYEYLVETTQETLNGKIVKKEEIKVLKEANDIDEIITKSNAESFLTENQKLLTKKNLEEYIAEKIVSTFEMKLPKIQIWKANPEFLIDTKISLTKFKEDNSISFPLRNMFHIYGKTSDKEIKLSIERALTNQARTDELVDKMSSSVTQHINKIWKEHKIKIRVSINGDLCQVFVEDKDKKHTYYSMNQRSEGFKQFISLILSLSALNESNKLMNNIILIDEPEVHLHPSGVRYMRNEILKIGRNNNIFVATHSHYMVDTLCPERHWIVSKEKSETSVKQISEDTPFEDDTVLASAFGLNLFKELLPNNIIVVEGADDKSVIAHAINLVKSRFFYSIKTAKGASKAYSIAAFLNEEQITAYFLFDDDKDGRDYKNKILDNYKESFSEKNVFTLRDINNFLPPDCTLEDLMPIDFVKEFFEENLPTTFSLIEGRAVISQLKNQNETIKNNKQKLDSLKVQLSKKFVSRYNTKQKLEQESPNLVAVVNSLVQIIDNNI